MQHAAFQTPVRSSSSVNALSRGFGVYGMDSPSHLPFCMHARNALIAVETKKQLHKALDGLGRYLMISPGNVCTSFLFPRTYLRHSYRVPVSSCCVCAVAISRGILHLHRFIVVWGLIAQLFIPRTRPRWRGFTFP